MLKLTRLNNHLVAINPDHICWVDATPDTTLFLLGGEKIIVRESIDDLIARLIQFRRSVRRADTGAIALDDHEGDPPRVIPTRTSEAARISSLPPRSARGNQ